MLMFLSILCASLIAIAVFAAIQSAVDQGREPQVEMKVAEQPAKFFGGDIAPVEDAVQLPVEMLLSQIERHVRLEQAAAERFLAGPSRESLRAGTNPPAVN